MSHQWMEDRILRYLDGLRKGSLEIMQELFTARAEVKSPLYGLMPAMEFYEVLFATTTKSEIDLIDIQVSTRHRRTASALFEYGWKLTNGEDTRFKCVDVFQFAPLRRRISSLTIIYDTRLVRDESGQPYASNVPQLEQNIALQGA